MPPTLLWEVCWGGQRIRRFPSSFSLAGGVARGLRVMVSKCHTSQTPHYSLLFLSLPFFSWFFTSDLQATSEELLGFWSSTGGVEVVFGFTTDHAPFPVHSASVETNSFSKGTFSTWGLRFDVFSESGLEGADNRVLSLLASLLKNSLILGCDSATFSEFKGVIRVTFFVLCIDIFMMLVFF